MQWGIAKIRDEGASLMNDTNDCNIIFPIPFPHKCFSVNGSIHIDRKVYGNVSLIVKSKNQNGAYLLADTDAGYNDEIKLGTNLNGNIEWIAIGY